MIARPHTCYSSTYLTRFKATSLRDNALLETLRICANPARDYNSAIAVFGFAEAIQTFALPDVRTLIFPCFSLYSRAQICSIVRESRALPIRIVVQAGST